MVKDKYATRGTDKGQNTHQQVKAKILERMAGWAEMFARDPDLGIMEQAYTKLKSQSTARRSDVIESEWLTGIQILIFIHLPNRPNARLPT